MGKVAENSMKTVVGRPFAPGVSGNPGGRPKGLASYIRETTDGGREMVDLMVAVMRGEAINGMRPKITDMVAASTWLADRGFGKPVTSVESTTRSMSVDMTLGAMSSERLFSLLRATEVEN